MKQLLLLSILVLGLSTVASAQYADVNAAVSAINAITSAAPAPCTFEVTANGLAKKLDSEYTDVVYDFNMNDVELVQYEAELRQHRIKFVCASGNKCFHCEKNAGAGVFHYIEINSKEEGETIVAAFMYIKSQVSF
ncbi:MAG: hypothetical protein ACPG19_07945 [Saprospiraceae bacterium]